MPDDKGYDSGDYLNSLRDGHEIKPVIDIRNYRQDADKTKLVPGCEKRVYHYQAKDACVCFQTNEDREIADDGLYCYREYFIGNKIFLNSQ